MQKYDFWDTSVLRHSQMKTLGTKQQIIIIFKQTCSMCKLPCELNLQKIHKKITRKKQKGYLGKNSKFTKKNLKKY